MIYAITIFHSIKFVASYSVLISIISLHKFISCSASLLFGRRFYLIFQNLFFVYFSIVETCGYRSISQFKLVYGSGVENLLDLYYTSKHLLILYVLNVNMLSICLPHHYGTSV